MINLRSTLLVLLLGLSAAACQKAPDLGKIQAQGLLTVKSYTGQLEVLQRRADALVTTYRKMDQHLPGADAAVRRLGDARGDLEQLRAFTAGAPGAIGAAAKTGLPELQAAIDTTHAKLAAGIGKITADLTTFESWSAFARPAAVAVAPPAAPPTTPAAAEPAGDAPPAATP